MTILILNWRDIKHPLSGGAEISLSKHAQYWKNEGAKVIWFSSKFSENKNEEFLDGIRYIRKGNYYTGFIWFFLYFLLGKFKYTDIVIDCFHFIPYFTPLYLFKKKRIAFIHEVAGKIWFENLFYPLALFGYLIEPLIIKLYKKMPFITVSNSTKQSLVKHGISSENITVINNGVTFPQKIEHTAKEISPTLIFLARISKDKGIEDALMVTSLLKQDFKNIKIWIVGKQESPKYLKKIKEIAEKLELGKNCEFFGYVDEKKKFELLSKAWVLIHPSIREGWGLNVIEANHVGTPAAGYEVEGLVDSIIDKKTGRLVPLGIENLHIAVKEMLTDKTEYKKMVENAKTWSKNFDWNKSGAQSYKVLKDILHES